MLQVSIVGDASLLLQDTGSILLGCSPAQLEELQSRCTLLSSVGVPAQLLDHKQLKATEPALALACTPDSTGLLVSGDAQLVSHNGL